MPEGTGGSKSLRMSGLFLRRKSDKEFHSYIPLLDYDPNDYEVLLRMWGSEPFPRHLGALSGPMISGEDPEITLLKKSGDWVKNLAKKAEISNYKPLCSQKAVFLSVHGGAKQTDPVSGAATNIGIVLCYVVPIKQSDSSVISLFPDLPDYPKFYNFGSILHQMARSDIKIHPYTREMLACLDHWLREHHAISGGINSLFAPSLQSRMKMFISNPLYNLSTLATATLDTPNQSLTDDMSPLISSTPFSAPKASEENTLHETTIRSSDLTARDHQPVDMMVENPVFGSGLRLKKVDMVVANDHYGYGEPDYSALKNNKGKWAVQVQNDGLPDWTELFPMHKFCCEGDVDGVRKCIQLGMSASERDTDSWTPLHYACWYGELEVVKTLVEEAPAAIGIQNSSGSTPLHLAAGTGHAAVVTYLLKQRVGQGVKAALDSDGKSPLAVCLDNKMNDWTKTADILREAYTHPTPVDVSFPPPLLPYNSPHILSMEHLSPSIHNLLKAKHSKKKLKPVSIRRQRVSLGIGRHQMVHFFNGRETDCKDIILNLYKLINLPRNLHGVFALWIASNSLELQLGDGDQPLKLIYTWKKLLSKYAHGAALKGDAELPTLHLWRNVFYLPSAEHAIDNPLALEFLYAEAHRHVVNSQYPCSENDALFLAGITLQITYGDYNEMVHGTGFLKDKLDKVLPGHMIASRRKLEYEKKVLAKYAEICQYGFEDMKFLHQTYLKHCWKWPYYGATFYEATLHMKETKLEIKCKVPKKSQLPISIGINTNGFHLVNSEINTLLASVSLDGLDWDVSTARQEMVIFNENKTTYIAMHSKKVSLLYSLATRMREQYTATTN